MMQNILVSVVIPTRNRPELVCRAVRSALSQTFTNIEVVVVVDGPDVATGMKLASIADRRLRVVALEQNVGGTEARNIGIREARGTWIGLLDDDDEWLPQRVERQLVAIQHSSNDPLFAACRYFARSDRGQTIAPKLFPVSRGHISDYLFCELSLVGRRQTFLQTSTWLVRRDVFLEHPFTVGLRKNQDTDWLLRFFGVVNTRTCFVPEPLVVFHQGVSINRVSTTRDWEYTFQWARANAHLFTDKAFAYFLMTECARSALEQGHGFAALMFIWRQCSKRWRFAPRILYLFAVRLAINHTRYKYTSIKTLVQGRQRSI